MNFMHHIRLYINDAKLQLKVLSELHGHIQDVCNENGIELILPHYLAHRTAQHMVMNPEYIPKGYKGPAFDVKVNIEDKSDGKSKSK